MRQQGRLKPRHVLWSGKVTGTFQVVEERDSELSRSVRVARILAVPPTATPLLELYDVTIISAKPDWWTFTGWERIQDGSGVLPRTYQQSWILIPVELDT